MVDYFKTNWTQQMKINPVANMILNGKPKPDSRSIRTRKLYRIKKTGQLTLSDLVKYSSRVTRKYSEEELADYSSDEQELILKEPVTNYQTFMDIENKKPERKIKKKKVRRAKKRLEKRRRDRANAQQDEQQGQGIQQQGQQGNLHGEERPATIPEVVTVNDNVDDDLMENINAHGVPNEMEIARNKEAFGDRAREQAALHQENDVVVDTGLRGDPYAGGSGSEFENEEKGGDEFDSDDEYGNIKDGIKMTFDGGIRTGESGMWDNTYVKDYINIHHPKLLPDYYIQAMKQQPLQIKPPSVFFSDV